MDPLLDETSLLPCATWAPSKRISALASVLATLDRLGASRVLRSVTDAADRDLAGGRGLRGWCFDPGTNRDAGRFVATRLSRQPFIDGSDGLLAAAEGVRVLETRVNGQLVFGLGLAALENGVVSSLASAARPVGSTVVVKVFDATSDELSETTVPIFAYALGHEVDKNADSIRELVDDSICNGRALLQRFSEVFPHLILGRTAFDAIGSLTGTEPVYRQLLRHLRVLNTSVLEWAEGESFLPQGITFSPESALTLSHGRFGPIRDFPSPEGFNFERWSLHTKLTGGAGARLYFRPIWTDGVKVVLIGYFGSHLPCIRFPT